MNIEEAIEILKSFRKYNKFYREGNKELTITISFEAKESINNAIETLLTVYEKEKEKNEKYWKQNIEYQKTLERLQKETIWKDKVKSILQKYEHTEVGDEDKISDFYIELKELVKEE